MRIFIAAIAIAFILAALLWYFQLPPAQPVIPPPAMTEPIAEPALGGEPANAATGELARAREDVRALHEIYVATNDPSMDAQGRLVDRWGTPYHFHPRAAAAIDVRSAGPDRVLFTADDLVQPERAAALAPAPPSTTTPR